MFIRLTKYDESCYTNHKPITVNTKYIIDYEECRLDNNKKGTLISMHRPGQHYSYMKVVETVEEIDEMFGEDMFLDCRYKGENECGV